MSLAAIDRYLALEADWLPPATDSELASLERLLNGSIDVLWRLYSQANGSVTSPGIGGGCLPLRLMPIHEVLQLQGELSSIPYVHLYRPIWVFTDDTSNYAGVYTAQPLRAYATILDHDEDDASPRWVGVESLLRSAMSLNGDEYACDTPAMQSDLPCSTRPTVYEEAFAKSLLVLARDEPDHDLCRAQVFMAARFVSPPRAEVLSVFLQDQDMWIPERVAEMYGDWGWEPSVNALAALAERGVPNGDVAAVRALFKMRSKSAKAAIQRLLSCGKPRVVQAIEWHRRQ